MRFLNALLALLLLSRPAQGANFAIYHDSGVYGPSRRDLIRLLKQMNHSAKIIGPEAIRAGELKLETFDALIVPGGKSWIYLENLGTLGAENIRRFISQGGGYLGFCAGAFLALSDRLGGHTTGKYGISLIHGTSIDAFQLGIPGFNDGLKPIRFFMDGFKDTYQVSFLESPLLDIKEDSLKAQNGKVVARYAYQNLPAAVYFEFGHGKVFLTGPHMELEEKRKVDPDSEWPMLKLWINAVVGDRLPDTHKGLNVNFILSTSAKRMEL